MIGNLNCFVLLCTIVKHYKGSSYWNCCAQRRGRALRNGFGSWMEKVPWMTDLTCLDPKLPRNRIQVMIGMLQFFWRRQKRQSMLQISIVSRGTSWRWVTHGTGERRGHCFCCFLFEACRRVRAGHVGRPLGETVPRSAIVEVSDWQTVTLLSFVQCKTHWRQNGRS